MRESHDDVIARAAIWSLGQLLDERAIEPLIATMISQDPGNRWEAATNALVAFDRPEIDQQVDDLQRWRRDRLASWIKVPFSAELRVQRA